ncbi:MAG: N-acetylmuramoyl-L-alanine amidase [Acidobacteriota bacterium]|nr:N-acetylmuramoyl-L-alanine amidase [Acidobacteriota bacterium]
MTAATRLGAAALAALLCAGLAPAGPGSAHPEAGAVSATAKQLYEAARRAEATLRGSETAMRNKDRWEAVARKYRSVVLSFPRSGYCDDALHYEGGIYRDAAERFDDRRFGVRAADAFALLVRGYPASRWVPKALYEQVRLHAGRLDDEAVARRALERLRKRAPGAAETRMAAAVLAKPETPPRPVPASAAERPTDGTRRTVAVRQEVQPADPPTTVQNIRHWVGDSHTRVVIDLSGPTPHTEGRLTGPDRVFFDLHGATPDDELERRAFPIEGSHLRRIRLGVPEEKVTRVVLDFSSIREVSVFALPDPYRLVVDIHGAPPVQVADGSEDETAPEADDSPAGTTESAAPEAPGTGDEASPSLPRPTEGGYSLARQLGAGVNRIVIDAGHGGKDPGTHAGSLREKDIALDIAKRVRDDLTERGFEVIMTRDKDVFIPLEQRAFIANSRDADLFVSIHVNAARNRRARGLETFYLNLATSADAAEVAARENASTGMVRMADVRKLVDQIVNHSRKEESRELATTMQAAMTKSILGREDHPLNRGVKTAGFHVLLGAQMPAVLVEVGFVSNREEARQLRSASHRNKLASAIADGVDRYAATLGQAVRTTATQNER